MYRMLLTVVVVTVLAAGAGATACRQSPAAATPTAPPALTTPYSAVFLLNGQAFFGRLEGFGSPYPALTEVYYVQTQMNQDTKEVKNTLIKRGNEWHAPDRMLINAEHILFIEPVGQNSAVAKFIDELKKQQH